MASTQDLRGRNSKLLQRYQSKAVSQDPLQQPIDTSPFSKSTGQRSLQNSTLLQKHYARASSQNIPSEPSTQPNSNTTEPGKITGSQRSLERSKLLQRYSKQHSLDSQDVPKAAEPQIYSSQKSLQSSKLLQRYNPNTNSQDFTGLSAREGTPVARFARSGSLDHDRQVRPSLLSRYTPRFGKSLDRNKSFETEAYSAYSSQRSLDQPGVSQSQTIGDYSSDHFDQYDSRNLRSRSSSMAKGLARSSGSREFLPASKRVQLEKENIPLDPVTPETLPMIAAPEPVLGNIASALPMPMLNIVPPTPMVEVSPPPMQPTQVQTLPVQPPVEASVPIEPPRSEPVKPLRKDLSASATETRVVPKDPSPPSPPLFSDRDRMQHYGSASKTLPSSTLSSKPTIAPISQTKKATLVLPVSDLSGRQSLTDLRKPTLEEKHPPALEIDETSERNELRRFSLQKEPVKRTLESAFENIAALSVPHAVSTHEEEQEVIEIMPTSRKLKKRDHTYHPSFVPKQTEQQDKDLKELETKIKLEMKKIEHDRKKEEERIRKEEERLRKERDKQKKQTDKIKNEEEKRHKEEERKFKLDEDKRIREEEKKMKAEEEKIRREEERFAKEEEKRLKEEEKRKRDEEKKKQKEEKKKGVLKKSLSADQEPSAQPEDEPIDFGSHLEQYSISGPEKPRSISASRARSDATPVGSTRALNRHTLPAMSKPIYSSQQSLDRATGVQSKMLQRYTKRSGSQDYTAHTTVDDETEKFLREVHRSQGSLDHQRMARSSLLQKYTPKPSGASIGGPSSQPASVTMTTTVPKTTSEVSLDKSRLEKSTLLQRYSKPRSDSTEPPPAVVISGETDKEQRLSSVVFKQQKKRPEKYDAFDYRDHEYEPIGEVIDKPAEPKAPAAVSLALPGGEIKRKLSSASLRVPDDDADTISMEELQKDIEDRYFNRPGEEEHEDRTETAEPVEGPVEKGSKMKAVMARAQQSGKKAMARAQESSKNAMVKAQAGGKSLHQKLRKQTEKFKTKMSNINVKKDKDVAPLASPEIVTTPEIERLDFTIAEPKPEQETGEIEPPAVTITAEQTADTTEETALESTTGKKKFKGLKMPKLQKPEFKIAKPKMPKLKTPDMSKFKRPEMPKFLTEKPDFSKLKMPEKIGTIKLHRSKSLKESSVPSAASPSDVETPSVTSAEGAKKKVAYTDFSTYPRILDKFKRQKSAPSNASVRASTPPPLEFSKAGKTTRPKGPKFISRWAEKSSEDTESNRFFSGSELGERESSVEKRMRQRLDRAEFEPPELPVTAEQKQLEEYDKENREIHLLSAARHDEFLKRKPPMERQESDLASEEEKQFWASSLGQKIRQNIDMNSNDFDFLDEEDRLRRENEAVEGLSDRDRARFLGEPTEQSEKDYDMRSTTPYSNKECQSSGSSGIRRRKGVLEEIDDDEFFLRQKGVSKDNIQMGEYISLAIKEGLSTPKNALAEMGRYEPYDDEELDVSERASMDYRGEAGASGLRYYQPSFESDDVSNKQSFTDEFHRDVDFFKTFPPDRPARKQRKEINVEPQEEDIQKVPYDTYQPADREDEVEFYNRNRKYSSEPPQVGLEKDEHYIDDENIGNEFSRTGTAVPPTPPRRRKKRFRDVAPPDLEPFSNGLTKKTIYNSFTIGPETHLYPAEVPLAEEESFTTPLPTPRRSRSRSQLSKFSEDDRAFRATYVFGFEDSAMDKGTFGVSESNDYAVVRKEPPPRPPAPIRRRKSTRSLEGQRQFNTLPNYHSVSPMRPTRNYSTISPNRPPRNKSVSSLNENQPKMSHDSREDIREYEEIEDMENQIKLQQALQSGAIVSKMKDRPLPPPPRPPRDGRKPRKHDIEDDIDGGAERIVALDQHGPRVVEEVEIAIQTDPVSEDYELDIEVSETIGAVGGDPFEAPSKTLQEILKEEQQAEIDRARQLAEMDNLMKNIQKFRDSTSSLSLQGSRPETPAAAVLIERRVSSPYSSNARAEHVIRPVSTDNLTEQDLADDDKFIAELVKKYVSDEKVTETPRKQAKPAVSDAVEASISREERSALKAEPAAPPRTRSLVASDQDLTRSVEIPSNVIEEIVERLRTNEQQHIAELQQLHQQQVEELRKHQEEQRQQQEQKLEEQQKQLLQQQNQQLHETQQLKEQILLQQEQQKALLLQQQQQQQQLLLAQQQQQILLEQQEKERELQREKERELLREREIELEKARERERELHHARELELQRARDLEQQRAKELEQQRLHELELQRAMEMEHQRLRELEIQRIQEAEAQRAREAELQHTMEAELQRVREAETRRIREAEAQMIKELEKLTAKETTSKDSEKVTTAEQEVEAEVPQKPADVDKPAQEVAKEPPPVRPPLPRYSPQTPMSYPEYLQYPLPPQAFYPGRNYSDDEGAVPQAPQRRRRHHRSRRESTSEEELQREQRKHRHETRSPEPSIPALSSQLLRACGSSIRQTGDDLMNILRASSKDEHKRDLHIALIILIVIVAGLMALGMSAEKAVHHHHWDYFNPPGNSGKS
ncbi:trichohyalin isoform X2 [Wyeomyia smithii]|uniref:trichohyalin isoform X2 n=1 Tax=Wyeomyia smithii TaxID=174621 RepID=UPI002467C313|nr:trichohyalin isoform X2 [Wyeomyia smithii]